MDSAAVKQALESLFTMTVSFDRELKILSSSERLQLRCPAAKGHASLTDVFEFQRPAAIKTFTDITAHAGSLFLMISRNRQIALRGQVFLPHGENSSWAIFLGSPWLLWMTENQPDLALEMADYPKHDAQLDHEFYIASQKAVVQDLEILNAELREARDAAQQAEKTRSSFFAIMSHEMRTPLNGVISSLSLIEDTEDQATRDKLLGVARASASNLLSVINYVLDYSKLEAGKLELEEVPFDIKECLNSVVDILHSKASSKGIELKCTLVGDPPLWVRGDASKITQILLNLASNAVKFTEQGGVEIRVTCDSRNDGDNAEFCFEIEDTGTGIKQEDQAQIFQPFWSASSKSPAGDDNTGLGLNICARLVELLKGDISFVSQSGQGTCFKVVLPLRISEKPAVKAVPAGNQAVAKDISYSGNVLLVDDNQTNLLVGQMMLENLGLEVRTASDGEEALGIATQVNFDLVLMDITMPEMSGIEVTERLRAQGYRQPIVALTAHVGEDARTEYLNAGMQNVLYKPIEPDALVRVLGEWLPEQVPEDADEERLSEDVGAAVLISDDMLEALVANIGSANIQRVFDTFEKESSNRVKNILSAWVQQDLRLLADEAHTLKSSSASFGAASLAQSLKAIEQASRDGDTERLVTMLSEVEETHNSSIESLRHKLAVMTPQD